MVPLIFEQYAPQTAARVPSDAGCVLELACGTGVVTRALAGTCSADIVATDLSQAMLDQAAAIGTSRPVEWRQADALDLPFEDESFDAVVCQFGVMFFPDKARAFAEARRVLRPGGVYVFAVWGRIEDNEFADDVTNAVAAMFPDDPPNFLPRTPYAYYDRAVIERDVGSGVVAFETVTERSLASGPDVPAIAFCQGTLLRDEIEDRDPSRLQEATDRSTDAIAKRFGTGAVDGKIEAHIVTVRK